MARTALPPTPLIEHLQGLIERTYALPRLVGDAGRFLVGDRGYRWLYGGNDGAAAPVELSARLMVRTAGGQTGSTQAALYYPDALVRHLEIHDPRRSLDDRNIDAFATFAEELDHLITLASRSAAGRTVSLIELEHHAAVTKYLLVVHFLGKMTRRRRVADLHRMWARHHLFEKYAAEGEDAERYRTAARLAGRYVALLDRMPAADRRAELVAFHDRPFAEQVRHVEGR
ncbi:MAG TPA: hypothetical protein VJV75_09845 [Candidatus Polarisedimenticolia bacterium]|nr:hypothetical protein [Candidatus Polarisedimenticolia bacterium]